MFRFRLLLIVLTVVVLTGVVCAVVAARSSTSQSARSEKIPLILHQTNTHRTTIPAKVFQNVLHFAPDFEHRVYDDQQCLTFLREHFDVSVVNTYLRLKGPHRADLFRYCVLYVHGGLYLDIKTELVRPLLQVCDLSAHSLYTVLNYRSNQIYQGILFARPGHPLIHRLIQNVVKIGDPVHNYHAFCDDFYQQLRQETVDHEVRAGLNRTRSGWDVYLFQERCSTQAGDCTDGLDRHGLCCHVWDQDSHVFKTRYADYPWPIPPLQVGAEEWRAAIARTSSSHRDRVLVYSYDDRLPHRADLQRLKDVNREYCLAQGHEFLFEEHPMDISPYWVKVRRIKELLSTGRYDYLLWIDSDVALVNHEASVPSLFARHPHAFLVKSTDPPKWKNDFNAGVFAVRRCDLALEFLHEWWTGYDARKWQRDGAGRWQCVGCGEWANSVDYEQGRATQLLRQPKYAGKFITFHWSVMQDHRLDPRTPPPFSLHFAGDFKSSLARFLQTRP